jgi:hypothetical protein
MSQQILFLMRACFLVLDGQGSYLESQQGTNPILEDSAPWPNYCPKIPPLNSIILGLGCQPINLRRHKHSYYIIHTHTQKNQSGFKLPNNKTDNTRQQKNAFSVLGEGIFQSRILYAAKSLPDIKSFFNIKVSKTLTCFVTRFQEATWECASAKMGENH